MKAIDRHTVVYPDSDGEPMSDNTLQFQWIVVLKENLDAARPDFVGGDLLWYPVEGNNKIRRAPDVLVALGRPKGYRGSYKSWVEGGPPEVVMEVTSPSNTSAEMSQKLEFYRQYGAKEFYVVDPDNVAVQAWIDAGPDGEMTGLRPVASGDAIRSPRLGITFYVNGGLRVEHPDGTPFLTFAELVAERDRANEARDRANEARDRAIEARDRAIEERDTLLAQLRALGVDPSE